MPGRLALAEGGPLTLPDDAPTTISRGIAARVAACPAGVIRTYGVEGVSRSVTYEAAWARSARIAAALANTGVAHDEPVILVIDDAVDFAPALWACLRGGHVVLALTSAVEAATNPTKELALRRLLGKLKNPLLLVDQRFGRESVIGALVRDYRILPLAAANEVTAPWDEAIERPPPVCLVATSGSTGTFKLATLDERALRYRYFSSDRPGPRPGVHSLGLFPLDSMSGLRMGFLVCETFTQIPKEAVTQRPDLILTATSAFRISGLSLTNSLASRLLEIEPSIEGELDFSCVRSCGLGGETVSRDIAARLGAMFARRGAPDVIFAGYGATEVGDIVAAANPLAGPASDDHSVRLGPCAPGVSLRIVADGAVLEEGAVGEVEVAAPLKMFSGYWDDADLTGAAFTADGWWKTGDLGQLDDGVFTFKGRSKETLVIHGRKLSLTEIDAYLRSLPEIRPQVFSCVVRSADDVTDRLGIAFVANQADPACHEAVADAIRSATLRQFGVRPDPVVPVWRTKLPLTSTGKIRRDDLAVLLTTQERRLLKKGGPATSVQAEFAADEIEAALDGIWREVLNLDAGFDRSRTFLDCGGDSLRSAALYASVEARFGRQLAMDAFFADPTFDNLVRLVGQPQVQESEQGDGVAWPLPTAFRARQLAFMEAWAGERCTSDRLVTGLNRGGRLPPLFCVLQTAEEFAGLAAALGPEQPVFAFRSGHRIARYTEDIVQSIALRYVHDIQQVRPNGPLFLLGQCQGATLAIAMAQHLVRRGRYIPLLVLADWSTRPAHYAGPTLLLHGHDSIMNPRRYHYDPASAWRRMFPDHAFAEVPGTYGRLYFEENVDGLAQELRTRFAASLSRPPWFLPDGFCRIELDVGAVPRRLTVGERIALDVSVRNVGDIVVSSHVSGLLLGNYWTRDDDTTGNRLDARMPLPDLEPGGTARTVLTVRAPSEPGQYRLCLDVVEEGHRWINPINQGCAHIDVDVLALGVAA